MSEDHVHPDGAPSRPIDPAVIYLIGVPAVGKYTIAREIGRQTHARVVDNQLINLPVFTVLGYDGTDSFPFPPRAWDYIATIREAVLSVIRECVTGGSFVFTNVLEAGDPGDAAVFREIEQLAADRHAGFYPVWLTARAEDIRRRKASPDRRRRLKDTDLGNVAWYADGFDLLRVAHPNALTLDTSGQTVEWAATRIIDHVQAAGRRDEPGAGGIDRREETARGR